MKTILLILGILILLSKRGEIKNIFRSQQTIKNLAIKSLEDAKNSLKSSKIEVESVMTISGLIIVLVYTIFYLLAAIKINSFIFTLISIFLIFESFRSYSKIVNNLKDMTNYIPQGFIYRISNLTIDLCYIGYVFYNIYLTW